MPTWAKNVLHTLASGLIWIVPLVLAHSAGWGDLTISGLLQWAYSHWIIPAANKSTV